MRPIREKKSTKLGEFYYPPNIKKIKKTKTIQKKIAINPQREISRQASVPIAVPIQTRRQLAPRSPVLPVTAGVQNLDQRQVTPPVANPDLEELYNNPNLPTSYSGDLQKYIQQKESISVHKKKINIFKRRQIFVIGPWVAIQADTAFYIDTGPQNSGYKYILGKLLSFI